METIRPSAPKYRESGNQIAAPGGNSQSFNTFSNFLGSAHKTGLQPGTGFIGAGGASSQWTTSAQPTWTSWSNPTPLGRLCHIGWWRMVLGLADSLMNFLGLYRLGFETPGMTGGGGFLWIPGKGNWSTPYLVTLPPGWNQSQGWRSSPWRVLTHTERCTTYTCSSPSWSDHILQIDVY